MRPLFICDLDGVIFDFDRGWVTRHRQYFRRSKLRPGTPQRWGELHTLAGFDTELEFWVWWERTGGFGNLPTYPGAVEAVWSAIESGWEVAYATNRPEQYKWQTGHELARVDLPPGPLLFTRHKWELAGDLFVDDSPSNLLEFRRRRMPIYRMARPWNRDADYPELAGMPTIPDLTVHHLEPVLAFREAAINSALP